MAQKRIKQAAVAEAAVMAGMMILLACLFDYRYATNDDIFIKAIVSGQYSGTPDIHNISCNVFINGVFAVLYRVCGFVPWFGIFLVVSQFLSLYWILTCIAEKMRFSKPYRYICAAAVNILFLGIMLQELVIIQYTYTAALLIVSATARLYCEAGRETSAGGGRLKFAGLLVHFLLAFCLRTEIFLFLLPFSVLLSITCCHSGREAKFSGKKVKCLGAFWSVLALCVLGLYAADYIGYTGEGYREYRKVDDSRTQLYDFLTLPDYEEDREFYEAAGITKAQHTLLKNYNFALDEEITSQMLKSIVDHVNEGRITQYQGLKKQYMRMFTLPLNEGIWSYTHRVLADPKVAGEDYPWNFVCAALYLVLLLVTCLTRRMRNLIYIVLMLSMRSVLWMYIILKQRTPPRVTHSLFIMEIVCLLLLVFEELSYLNEAAGSEKRSSGGLQQKGDRKKRWLYSGMAVLFLAGAGVVAVHAGAGFGKVYKETIAFNEEWKDLLEYCSAREENFYFLDVYSTVNYTEEVFGEEIFRPENYDICGGWLAKSPLCGEKYGHFGFSSPRTALVEMENVFFVAKQGTDLGWLREMYEEKGIQIRMEYQETAGGIFDIIKLSVGSQPE